MADSRASASAGSSNPFRRKSTTAPGVSSSAAIAIDPIFESPSDSPNLPPQHPNTSDLFRQQLEALPHTNEPPPSTTFQKPKVVKKVRVQSPPPSSPESAGAPHQYPAYGYPEEDSENSSSSDDEEEPEDPFRGMAPPLGVIGHANYSVPASALPVPGQPPPNPFKKTLEDMEHGSNDGAPIPNAAAGGKGSLDVDAFKRLLMTGQAKASGTVPVPSVSGSSTNNLPSSQAADSASFTDASSVSRQSIFDSVVAQETPRTSHEISDAEGEEDRLGLVTNPQAKTQQTASTLRKKPPPPSSRHGKLIKVDLSKKDNNPILALDGIPRPSSSSSQTIVPGSPSSTSSSRLRPSTPSDVNKPLPPAPMRRSMDEGSESIFDREAAGKVPEPVDTHFDADVIPTPRPPTPPNASHATTTELRSSDPRKPPPPPRRKSHSQTESQFSMTRKLSIPVVPTFADEPSSMRRSSQDSTRSHSSSVRLSMHAPAPPPPRRPNHASRPSVTSSSLASAVGLTTANASSTSSPGPSDGEHPPLHSPVPLVASPDPVWFGLTSLNASAIPSPATAMSPTVTKTKMSPPPLPPARNASGRTAAGRPASLRSVEATSRRVKDGSPPSLVPPPPPPKRSRAGSGRDRGALLGGPVTEEPEPPPDSGGSVGASEEKSADEILADLNALQREVDALRGKYEQKPAGI